MTFTKKQVKNLANASRVFQLKRLHESNGGYFFTDNNMRFSNSRVHDAVYGGCVFVTSEKAPSFRGSRHPRLYTVRYMDSDGNTHIVGDFQGFDTRSKAHTFAQNVGIQIDQVRLTL